jgi:hypothetical protein
MVLPAYTTTAASTTTHKRFGKISEKNIFQIYNAILFRCWKNLQISFKEWRTKIYEKLEKPHPSPLW